jgi:ribosome-associated protein
LQDEIKAAKPLAGKDLLLRLAELANDRKGHDIVALDVSELVYYTDFFLIVTGRTDQHVRGLTKTIEGELSKQDIDPIGIEGVNHYRWVLMDYGDVIVQIFFEPLRDLYELEKLWADAPRVDLKLVEPMATASFGDEEDDEDLFADFD